MTPTDQPENGNPVPWLEAVYENDITLPRLGQLVFADNDICGIVFGYIMPTMDDPIMLRVRNARTGEVVDIDPDDVTSSHDVTAYLELPRSKLRLVVSDCRDLAEVG